MDEIPRNIIENYVEGLNGISDACKRQITDAVDNVDFGADRETVIAQLRAILDGVTANGTEVAGELAVEFYDGIRERQTGERLGAKAKRSGASLTDEEFAELMGKDKEQVAQRMSIAAGQAVKRAAGRTILENAKSDEKRPRFARVPRATRSYVAGCKFCRILASQGFVYYSKKSAGAFNHYHSDCNCAVVPSWSREPKAQGYDTRDYMSDGSDAIRIKPTKTDKTAE